MTKIGKGCSDSGSISVYPVSGDGAVFESELERCKITSEIPFPIQEVHSASMDRVEEADQLHQIHRGGKSDSRIDAHPQIDIASAE